MIDAIKAAMIEYRRLEAAKLTKSFFDRVRAGWADWYFLHDGYYYPVKAIWANATEQPSPDFNTRDAKRGLRNAGFGSFVNLTLFGRGLDTVPDLGMSELDAISGGFGGGESEAHRQLKEWVSENPISVGLSEEAFGLTEQLLPSADRIDVFFVTETTVTAVEIKPQFSSAADLNRGIYQCVKYKALLKAIESLGNKRDVLVKLAIGGELPNELKSKAEALKIDVVERLNATAPEKRMN